MNSAPLSHLRVLDMTEALAGPYCAMLLGDLGADVIKIERPGVGDQSRRWGPPFLEGESAYYLSINRNKRSLELDIKDAEDQRLLHALLRRADVFLTNVPRMESLQRAAIDPETVAALNPALVYAAISGYGHSGPKAGRPGYDLIAQGEAGLMALTGEQGSGPMRFPTPMADITAGIYTLSGILAALYTRDHREHGSGKGQFLDIALVDSQLTWLANLGGSFFASGKRPEKIGNLHPSITPYQPIRARDRAIILAVGTERLWRKLCKVLALGEAVAEDPRFADNTARNRHRGELIPILEKALGQRDAEDWVRELATAGIPAGPINFPDHILADPHTLARRMVVELEHPLLGAIRSIANPIHLRDTAPTYRLYPPRLGEHNAEIRAELDL